MKGFESKDIKKLEKWFEAKDNSKSGKIGKLSTIALVIANIIPIFGLLYGGYTIEIILGIYWFESAVVAFYTIARIFYSGRSYGVITPIVLVAVIYFMIHFGLFMTVHLFVIGTPLIAKTFAIAKISILAIFLSHGLSFLVNFVGKQEYKNISIKEIMTLPYKRIFVMQFIIVSGGLIIGGLSLVLGTEVGAAVAIVLIKIFIDLVYHKKEHKTLASV